MPITTSFGGSVIPRYSQSSPGSQAVVGLVLPVRASSARSFAQRGCGRPSKPIIHCTGSYGDNLLLALRSAAGKGRAEDGAALG
jgi:hypothetical protein